MNPDNRVYSTAYRIVVTDETQEVWDSGTIEDDRS